LARQRMIEDNKQKEEETEKKLIMQERKRKAEELLVQREAESDERMEKTKYSSEKQNANTRRS
jgi:hypothetical protein